MEFGGYYNLENVIMRGCDDLENVIRYKKEGDMNDRVKKKNI